MLAATAFFAAMDAILKILAGHYPTFQVGALRGAASLPFILLPVLLTRGWRPFVPNRPGLHLFRGVLALIMMSGFIYAVRDLSLADAYSIFFVAPLLVTAMSVPLLKEHVDWQRWVAIATGLVGVLFMLRPSGNNFTVLGAVGALLSATAYAISAITVRVLSKTDTNAATVLWFLVLLTIFSGVLAFPDWMPVRPQDWPWIVLLGAIGAGGQHFITSAFRYAPASVIAPFEYTAMIWAVSLDWIVWSTFPSGRVYLGGGLVVACGLYLVWRERQLHVRTLAATAAEHP